MSWPFGFPGKKSTDSIKNSVILFKVLKFGCPDTLLQFTRLYKNI